MCVLTLDSWRSPDLPAWNRWSREFIARSPANGENRVLIHIKIQRIVRSST
jgi:hypothetical protein